MSKLALGIAAIIVIAGGGWYAYAHHGADRQATASDLGTYPYSCDNGSEFTLAPVEGLKQVQVYADAQGMFTGTTTLDQTAGANYQGAAPDGQQVALAGDGETIHLTVGSDQATCNPKPNPDEAPWNWGDPDTGADQSGAQAEAAGTFTGSVADLSARGGDWKCTVEDQASTPAGQTPSSGTVYVSGRRVRADFTTTAQGYGAVNSHLIADGTSVYSWSSIMPQGIKTAQADAGSDDDATSGSGDTADQRYTYQCAPAQADATLFVPPSSVTFRTL
jgi:hypothetical protein